jgi:hypothetical protein
MSKPQAFGETPKAVGEDARAPQSIRMDTAGGWAKIKRR